MNSIVSTLDQPRPAPAFKVPISAGLDNYQTALLDGVEPSRDILDAAGKSPVELRAGKALINTWRRGSNLWNSLGRLEEAAGKAAEEAAQAAALPSSVVEIAAAAGIEVGDYNALAQAAQFLAGRAKQKADAAFRAGLALDSAKSEATRLLNVTCRIAPTADMISLGNEILGFRGGIAARLEQLKLSAADRIKSLRAQVERLGDGHLSPRLQTEVGTADANDLQRRCRGEYLVAKERLAEAVELAGRREQIESDILADRARLVEAERQLAEAQEAILDSAAASPAFLRWPDD